MKRGYIYKIISPTNRIYIGKTFNLNKRIESYRGLCCKGQRLLFNSLSKHGWSNHTFEILFEDYCTNVELSKLESKFIIEYNSFRGYNSRFGMNLTLGGEGSLGMTHSEKTKKKISESKRNSERTEKQFIASERRKGQKVIKSEDWIKNNAEALKKIIYQYNLDGEFIREWKSAKDVEIELGFCRKNISANLRCVSRYAYGFIWMYKSKPNNKSVSYKVNKKRKGTKVFDIENNIIYESIAEVSKIKNIKYTTLYAMLFGINKNKTNFIIYDENIHGL